MDGPGHLLSLKVMRVSVRHLSLYTLLRSYSFR
jgi:hypothetical protein